MKFYIILIKSQKKSLFSNCKKTQYFLYELTKIIFKLYLIDIINI